MTEPTPIILSSPDAGNRSAGDILRRAREAQNLSLEGLASSIKVAPSKLEALELGQYDRLPDANFARALAMTVCRTLRIDPTEVLASLPAAKPTALAEGKPPLNQPFKEVRSGTPLFDQTMDWTSLLSFKWLAPLVLLVAAALIYLVPESANVPAWLAQVASMVSHGKETAAPVDSAASEPQAAPPAASATEMASLASAPVVAPASAASAASGGVTSLVLDAADAAASMPGQSPAQDPRLAASASAPSAAAATAGASALSSATGSGPLRLKVLEDSWIDVRDANGGKVLSRVVAAGESLSLDGATPMVVRIGNAPGVKLSYKGQAVDLEPLTRNNVARVELK